MSRNVLENRNQSKRNKSTCGASRNGKACTRDIEGDVLRSVRQFGSEVTRTVAQRAAGLRDTAADCITQGRKKARATKKSVRKRVEQRPLSSLMAACGMGLLIGIVAGRRR